MVLPFHLVNRRARFSQKRSQGSSQRPRARLRIELLEDRQVMSTLANPAVVPTPGNYAYWNWREPQILATPKGNPDVVFLGDSITDAFANSVGTPVWNARIAPLKADNFAVGGSTTQTALWQIEHDGVLNGISPQAVVLLIGTNNLAFGESPEQTAEGIAATVAAIEAKQPQAQILLLGVLPRGANPDDPMRGLVAQTNQLIAPLGDQSHVTYRDIGGAFLQPDGSLAPTIMGDYLHPTLLGYERMTAALLPTLDQVLESPAHFPVGPRTQKVTGNPDHAAPTNSQAAPTGLTAVLSSGSVAPLISPQSPVAASESRPETSELVNEAVPATAGTTTQGQTTPAELVQAVMTNPGDAPSWTDDLGANG